MTRKEQIKCANIEYTLKNRPKHIDGNSFAEMTDELNRNSAFEEGAEWADEHLNLESLWHDSSEEPQYDHKIMYQDELNHVWLSTYRKDIEQYKNWWEEYVACNYIVRWAYISDLLPKQFKNTEQPKGGEK